jgi:hypothetical protein
MELASRALPPAHARALGEFARMLNAEGIASLRCFCQHRCEISDAVSSRIAVKVQLLCAR